MKIKEFMEIRSRPVITIKPNENIHAVIHKLVDNNIGALPVCDSKGTLLGIITERDLLKACAKYGMDIEKSKVKDIMTEELVIGLPEDDITYVMEVMTRKAVRHLPVMVYCQPGS